MGAQKLNITLPDGMADAIKDRVESGRYLSTDDAMRAAISALLREEAFDDERLDSIRNRVQKSMNDPRPNLTGSDARRHLDALYGDVVEIVNVFYGRRDYDAILGNKR